jgi:hypothetical protein
MNSCNFSGHFSPQRHEVHKGFKKNNSFYVLRVLCALRGFYLFLLSHFFYEERVFKIRLPVLRIRGALRISPMLPVTIGE